MNVGIPGIGLGGLFFLISALLMPFIELARTVRGRSSPARWRFVARQFTMAVGIIAATMTMLWLFQLAVRGALPDAESGGKAAEAIATTVSILPIAPVIGTFLLLATLLCIVETLRWVFRPKSAV